MSVRAAKPRVIASLFVGIAFSLSAAPVSGQNVTVSAPTSAVVGADIDIRWSVIVDPLDFISIDEVGAAERTYGSYVYARTAQPASIRVPEIPGSYVVRYHSKERGYPVLATTVLEVVDTQASFEVLAPVDASQHVTINWTGPAHTRDFVSVDTVGMQDKRYGPYAYARTSPIEIRVPDQPGEYMVRYHLGQSYRVIGQTALTVRGVTATLDAESQVQAGKEIEVQWDGPDAVADYISIDPAGSPDRAYTTYAYTRFGSPLTVRVPEDAGSYEIRYHMGRSRTVLAAIDLEVLANSASVTGPTSVAAGANFATQWRGPDNTGDYVTIVPVDAGPREYLSYWYTRHGSPTDLEAPLEDGRYELRYMSGRGRKILARAEIEVTPGVVPGTLWVASGGRQGDTADNIGAVEVILDASGSMLQALGTELRMDIAKTSLEHLVRNVIPEGTPFALRVFGNREENSCRTDLEIARSPLNPDAASAQIQQIQPQSFARTAIGASLNQVAQDLAGVTGPATIVVVTDGEETCDGDPKAAIERLKAAGFDVRVNIVGFAVDELELKEQFQEWARAGNGRYVEANNGEQLEQAMTSALEIPFEVHRGGELIATGVVNGEPVILAPGTYQVTVLTTGSTEVMDVVIEPRGEHRLTTR